MSHAITYTQRNIAYCKSRERTLSQPNKDRKIVVILLILFIILFSILYIVQANSVATRGYEIQKYESEISKLQSVNEKLGLKLSEIRSLDYLEKRVKDLSMMKISRARVEYLSPTSQVAAR